MCDTVIAFGENGAFHIESPIRWFRNNLPADIKALFESKTIVSTYCMALGPGGGYVISYKTNSNLDTLSAKSIPTQLHTWLFAKSPTTDANLRFFPNLRVTLGANGKSFFASDGASFIWSDLPSDLEKYVQGQLVNGKFEVPPRLVSLGVKDNFVLINVRHGAIWDLGEYPEMRVQMEKIGRKGTMDNIVNMALCPFERNRVGIVLSNGFSAFDGIPMKYDAEVQAMRTSIQEDVRRKRQEELEDELEEEIEEERREWQLQKDLASIRGYHLYRTY